MIRVGTATESERSFSRSRNWEGEGFFICDLKIDIGHRQKSDRSTPNQDRAISRSDDQSQIATGKSSPHETGMVILFEIFFSRW